jgi:Na+/proline symporter
MSVVLCIYFVAKGLGFSFGEMVNAVVADKSSQMFFFDDPKAGTYFWKQFLAGVFMVIATTGLDQDMMQRNLACKDSKESQKNMIVSGVLQFFVIALFLILGTLLVMYLNNRGIAIPEKTDEIFGLVAASPEMPLIVGILFIVGLIAAAYSAAGSALTSLTTSFTVDILEGQKRFDESRLTRIRKFVHVGMSVVMGLVIIIFYYLSNQDAISAVYTLASYTYGPILGLFVFGMFSKRRVIDRLVPVVCIAAPVASWFIQYYLNELWQYKVSFELLIINALLTVVGMFILSIGKKQN